MAGRLATKSRLEDGDYNFISEVMSAHHHDLDWLKIK
jgi:hypothetical protein